MANFRFKKCELSDLTALRRISIETFSATYKAKNTEENFKKYITKNFNTSQLTRELFNSDTTFYLLFSEPSYRETRKPLIGYLKLNEGNAQSEKMEKHCYELERIYLTEEMQGKGFGRILIDKSIEVAKAKNKTELWLGVWDQNTTAIEFYKKMGFVEFGTHDFKLGEEDQVDILMKKEI
ncbi:MAG: GNAT family N-acetyltransferase [Saprospiraceae bacterium]